MFCSKCGFTLTEMSGLCSHCGKPVGDSKFFDAPYTSLQSPVTPGAPTPFESAAYTRTDYLSDDAAARKIPMDEDGRTSYRPAFEPGSIPAELSEMKEELRTDNKKEEEGSRPTLTVDDLSEETRNLLDDITKDLKLDDPLDLQNFKAEEITSSGQDGVSTEVQDLIRRFELADQKRSERAERRKRAQEARRLKTVQPVKAAQESENGGSVESETGKTTFVETENPEDPVFEELDEEDYVGEPQFGIKQVLKISVALVVIAALFIGGVMWVRRIRSAQSDAPIEAVTDSLYADGIALVTEHAGDEYINKMLSAYNSGGLSSLASSLEQGGAALKALMPEEKKENDDLLYKALNAVETNIQNAIMSDALAAGSNDAAVDTNSQERWTVVRNALAQLGAAQSAVDLTAVTNGEIVEVAAQPTPEPAPNYNTLSKGDKSNEVLDMQNRLYELGYLLDDRDGAFGSKTQTAVKMFQQDAGLEVTGIADNATLTAMYADDAPRTVYAQSTPQPAPTSTPVPEGINPQEIVPVPETEEAGSDDTEALGTASNVISGTMEL